MYNPIGLGQAHGLGTAPSSQGWWGKQQPEVKLLIGMGAALSAGALLWWLLAETGGYRQNRAMSAAKTSARRRITGKRGRSPLGRIKTVKGGRRFGHTAPPKRYWRMGARRPSDYAWPEGYKYPLIFRTSSGKVNVKRTKAHIRAASSYFSRSKKLYPMAIRRKIASRINKARKQYGIGAGKIKV